MKLKNIIFANGFIQALVNLETQRLPMGKAFTLKKLDKQVNEKAKIYDEVRLTLIDKYTEKDAEGKNVPVLDAEGKTLEGQVKITDPDAFNKEYQELLDIEEDYDFEKMTLPDSIEISTKDLVLLEDIIAE